MSVNERKCPKCGCPHVKDKDTLLLSDGGIEEMLQCHECGYYFFRAIREGEI